MRLFEDGISWSETFRSPENWSVDSVALDIHACIIGCLYSPVIWTLIECTLHHRARFLIPIRHSSSIQSRHIPLYSLRVAISLLHVRSVDQKTTKAVDWSMLTCRCGVSRHELARTMYIHPHVQETHRRVRVGLWYYTQNLRLMRSL